MHKWLLAGLTAASAWTAAQAYAASAPQPLTIATTACPSGQQGQPYTGCAISATGGTPPYTLSVDNSGSYAALPEGLSLNSASGLITGAIIGAQGSYQPRIVVTDHAGSQASKQINFSFAGSNKFLATLFPANSIFHHRVDAATTGLPVDASPAAPIYSPYLPAVMHPMFGNAAYDSYPNGIPVIAVAYNQPNVSVTTTTYQSYFTSGPIPSYAPVEGTANQAGDRHVLVYRLAGGTLSPALYEMWEGVYKNGPWQDASNALWTNTNSYALTPQGTGATNAAGLPESVLLINADEVIGAGTATAPKGAIQHAIGFTINYMLDYWVWPATQAAGVRTCNSKSGVIPAETEISQSNPPVSCGWSGPAGQIYRLKASVATPSCAASSPQAAIIITAFRNYGIILSDNGLSGGFAGTPDSRWNDSDLACTKYLTLADFEPVNVSSLMVNNDSSATKQ